MRPPIQGLRLGPGRLEKTCRQCTQRALWCQPDRPPRFARSFSKSAPKSPLPRAPASGAQRFRPGYFLSNSLLARFNGTSSVPSPPPADAQLASATPDIPADDKSLLPHRRRQAARRNAAATPLITPPTNSMATSLPPDASSSLADTAARAPADSLRRQLSALLSLSKPRLTVLVVLSAMVPYALYPVPAFLASASTTAAAAAAANIPSLSPLTLLFLTTGTTLCSAAANALNMLYEPDTDAKMSRTRTRPLVRRLLTTRAAVLFAVGCAAAGTAALYLGVNPTVAFLGAANIVLYAGVYTPLKRVSAVNTWVGAIVGGIPPLMGWAAAAGESATGEGTWRELLFASDGSSLGGWLFAGLLFAWQFPHFMPLSWGIREEYKAAGLRMLCWVNPARNTRVALRYSLVFVPLCLGLCAAGVTEWSFAVTSLPVNLWLVREAVKFWRYEGHKGSARSLFWASVWHLPVIMVLALAQKKGMWARVWRSVVGEPDEEDEFDEDDAEWVVEDAGPSAGSAVGIVGPAGERRR
ncbi:mitochondrial Protoheme IX farnesyltransferase [Chaetomidium leptoderma]|uniref:Protoheme IX farnesyltransferase, mitochondrial n=1 Tax=Chaetomidium leptoderma TaxID=669021 RepID=A0AAN6ZT32_9PEZI|nr:mitochondrial Protoheme IX farnesyltransferase [Chaetomidium leptoderma]